jgi:hypothetical protein
MTVDLACRAGGPEPVRKLRFWVPHTRVVFTPTGSGRVGSLKFPAFGLDAAGFDFSPSPFAPANLENDLWR